MIQLVEYLTLDFCSGHNPRVLDSSSLPGSVLSMEPAYDSLSLSLFLSLSTCTLPSPPLSPACTLSLSNNNNKIKAIPRKGRGILPGKQE